MKASWKKYTLNFKQPAGTSRGVLRTKDSYFLILDDGERRGVGECGLLRGLSVDDRPDYEVKLDWLTENMQRPSEELFGELVEFPSIQFGLEMALLDLKSEEHILFPSAFTAGNVMQPINGLIWMGDTNFMNQQVGDKIDAGFKVLKMKIGAIGLQQEMEILKSIRKEFMASELELRVDANGAFAPDEALGILNHLAELQIHSIEQPIKTKQWHEMAALCESSPIDIALDEELIGLFQSAERRKLLHDVKPAYIIIKPSFIGGFRGSEEWINMARELNIGWWATSALESNLGLSAIAQWNFTKNNSMPSGLGTGSLYTNNFKSPLKVKEGGLWYELNRDWEIGL